MITIGLAQIKIGEASVEGIMPGELVKIGKTYRDSCKINQEKSEATEHYEEGMAAPEIRKKSRKIPKLTFSIMDCDIKDLAAYVGGEVIGGKWCYDGNEVVANKAIYVEAEQGLDFEIPNCDIEAVVNADMSAKGIFLVDFECTPMSVTKGKALRAVPKVANSLKVDNTTLSFASTADQSGKTITVTSTGNVTSAKAPDDIEWLTVTKNQKVVTVKVVENKNSESRSADITITADGKTAIVKVTQAGAA